MRLRHSHSLFRIALVCAFAVVICVGIYVFTRPAQAAQYAPETFRQGVTVEGVDISGMTPAQAAQALAPVENAILEEISLPLTLDGTRCVLTADDLGVQLNTAQVLAHALLAGTQGNFFERMADVRDLQQNGRNYALQYTVTAAPSRAALDALAAQLSYPAQDASVQFDASVQGHFVYTNDRAGRTVDAEALYQAVSARIARREYGTLVIPAQDIPPQVTREQLQKSIVRRAVFSTSFAKSPYNDANRVSNIKKCVNIINGKDLTLAPGETLSLNSVLGNRTRAGGWKLAPGYVGGRSEDQPGGGVCQVSTTLYCAALCADLEIVQRSNHSIPVGYAKMGLDATISSGGPDLVLRNNTGASVYICCVLTAEQKIYFYVYGEPFDGFDQIRLTSSKVKTIVPSEEETTIYDPDQPAGYEKQYVKRRNGSIWRAWKEYYLNGERVRHTETFKSTYKAYAGERIVGTGEI